MDVSFQTLVLAAGKGTRMQSEKPKVLHEILGEPMLGYALRAAVGADTSRLIPVLGYGRQQVESFCTDFTGRYGGELDLKCAYQENQKGTAHAVQAALEALDPKCDYTLILSGDVPAVQAEHLNRFIQAVAHSTSSIGLVSAKLDDPTGYGRIVRGSDEKVRGIVEEADATSEQKGIKEINAGIYLVRTDFLREIVPEICEGKPGNAQGEYYLTDMVSRVEDVHGWTVEDPRDIMGVNTREALVEASQHIRRRINRNWLRQGVTIRAPSQTYIGPNVELAADVEIFPNVHLYGNTSISEGVRIEEGTRIEDCHINSGVHIRSNSYLRRAEVGSETSVGPCAHLRPGAKIGANCKVGNYVEVKKAELKDGAKAGHLAYIGDATVGEGANIGAGTITCNYDGKNKHHTEIGNGAFTGSNSALVAPVELGEDSYVAAGSTITDDVPPKALGIARGRQKNIEDWTDKSEE